MEKKRFIFDLDGTLLTADFSVEKLYFENNFGTSAHLLTSQIGKLLDQYERFYQKYDKKLLGNFLTNKTGLDITETIIDGWIDAMANVKDEMEMGVIELLEYLKDKGHSLAVLTNWFSATQIPRLENSGLITYFDEIYTGEKVLKPHQIAYKTAIGEFFPNDCIMVGDNLEKDYIGPRRCSIESILYDKDNNHGTCLVKVKSMNEIIKKY